MKTKTVTTIITVFLLAGVLTGCQPSAPDITKPIDNTKELQEELDQRTEEINNYNPTLTPDK